MTENGISYTRMRSRPDVNSERGSRLTNNDELEILSEEVAGWYQVRVVRSAVAESVGEVAWIERWLVDGEPAPPTPTAAPTSRPQPRLRVYLKDYNDKPACISMQIVGTNVNGWVLSIDGLNLSGTFDGGGNASVCGLANYQEVTISILNRGRVVTGGGGVPAKGSAILIGEWR